MAAIDEALAAHRNGDVARAEALFRAILTADARNFDALHMLGIICAQRGNFNEAEQHCAQPVASLGLSCACCSRYSCCGS